MRLNPATLERTKRGAITGKISLSYGETYFPDRDWSDFPVVILGWWLRALGTLMAGASDALFRFMDGPFEYVVTASDSGWAVSLMNNTDSRVVAAEGPIDQVAFKESLLSCADQLLRACRERGWETDADRAELATALHDLTVT